MPVTTDTTVEVSSTGDVSQRKLDLAVEKIGAAADIAREPVLHMEVRLRLEPNPTRERPAIAEATLNIDGVPIRAHVAAGTVDEAVDLLVDKMRRRIRRKEQRRHQLHLRHRTGDSGPGEWRHGDLPTERPEYQPRPYDEREVARTKTFALDPMTIDEALFDLDQLGHEFYLFVDEATGVDCIVASNGSEPMLQTVDPSRYEGAPDSGAAISAQAPPMLDLIDAKEHLDNSGDRYLFYRSLSTDRGHVLYRRYDGHYGLVTPA